jgi:hypothetical protein
MSKENKQGKSAALSPFEIALAAKRGTVPKESLHGAARLLYRQHTEAELLQYAKTPTPRTESKPHLFSSKGMMRGRS